MISSLPVLLIMLVPFFAGIACWGIVRKPRSSEIARPLTQTSLAFAMGTWWLHADQLLSEATGSFALSLIPWILAFHLLLTLLMVKQDEGALTLHPTALLLSASFLCGICFSTDLRFLFLFGEAISVTTWLTLPAAQHRSAILRSIVTFGMLAAGILLVSSEMKTCQFDTWRPLSELNTDQSEAAFYAQPSSSAGTALSVGVLCLIFGSAWRIGFFPFQLPFSDEKSWDEIQRLTGLISSSVLLLAIVLPDIPGMESIGQMLLATFAIPTLIRETLKSGWVDNMTFRLRGWFLASAALMWLAIGQELFLISHSVALGLWLPSGRELFRIEFISSIFSFIVLMGVLHELTRLGKPCLQKEDLSGFLWSHPLPALVILVSMFSWVGVPGLMGFESRLGLIAGAFEIAGAGVESAAGYSLMGVIIVSSEIVLFFLALMMLQTLCDATASHRSQSKRVSWRLCVLAILIVALRAFK
jgi:formate hydrogenlyase subunit 3/multisubunit Na+/H+ antiporter MnhD subunit